MSIHRFPIIIIIIIILLFAHIHAQILPSLPQVPPSPTASITPSPTQSPTPTPTPPPSPSNSPPPTPSPSQPAVAIIPPVNNPLQIPEQPAPADTEVVSDPSRAPTPSSSPSATAAPSPSLSQSPPPPVESAPPQATQSADKICRRDTRNPTPVPGRSAPRVALSVVATAAAVGIVSVLYSLAADWRIEKPYTMLRLTWIILARFLTIAAVKVSAALVAAITSADSDGSAFDASGAYLTWVSAISTRVYYEAIRMTIDAIEVGGRGGSAWDAKLRDFINRENQYYRIDTEEGQLDVHTSVYADITDAVSQQGFEARSQDNSFLLDKSTFFRRVTCSRFVKSLLLFTAALYVVHEIANLVLSLLEFINSLSPKENVSIFVAEGEGGQCGIRARDMGTLIPLALLQIVYSLFQQPSLIPISILGVFYVQEGGERSERENCRKYRWVAVTILIVWVVSLLVLPVFVSKLEPFLLVGDVSLFWYVLIAPPQFRSVTYIIAVVYAVVTACCGIVIIIRVSRSEANNVFKMPEQSLSPNTSPFSVEDVDGCGERLAVIR